MSKSVHGLDVAASTGVTLSAVTGVLTGSLGIALYNMVDTWKPAKNDPDGKKANKYAANSYYFFVVLLMFSLAFLMVYFPYLGYKAGVHQGGGGGGKPLKSYGTASAVLAYIVMIVTITGSALGMQTYKRAATFTDEKAAPGKNAASAKNIYSTMIAMIVIASIAFVLLTAYLADAKKHAIAFYESSRVGV